jgi:plasmid stabilization system protein ParE
MATVKWLPEAFNDLKRLIDFLKSKNPNAATRAANTIRDSANILGSSISIGRPMNDDTARRELIVPFASGAYVLRYKIDADGTAVIIRVWHSKEQRI